jgi:hypothetical protein
MVSRTRICATRTVRISTTRPMRLLTTSIWRSGSVGCANSAATERSSCSTCLNHSSYTVWPRIGKRSEARPPHPPKPAGARMSARALVDDDEEVLLVGGVPRDTLALWQLCGQDAVQLQILPIRHPAQRRARPASPPATSGPIPALCPRRCVHGCRRRSCRSRSRRGHCSWRGRVHVDLMYVRLWTVRGCGCDCV